MQKKRKLALRDQRLQSRLIALLKKRRLRIGVGPDGLVAYDRRLHSAVEDAVCRLRDSIFGKWQIIGFPNNWAGRYREYLLGRSIPFMEEVWDGTIRITIPASYRPLSWKWIDRLVIEDGEKRRRR